MTGAWRRGDAFKGMTFVVTGTLPTLSRDQATELIEVAGRPRHERRVEGD